MHLKGSDALTHYNLAVLYHEQGRLDEAEEEYKSASRYNPEFAEAHYNLGNP